MVMQKTTIFWLVVLGFVAGCSDNAEQGDSKEVVENKPEPERVVEKQVNVPDVIEEVPVDEGQAYMHINAQKPGVETLESGLQFEILEQGDGRSPGPTDTVVTHYHGTFINGDVFDSSVERGTPAAFPVNRVIKGWTEALQMMKEGDVWRLVIPPHLAYGERGRGGIPPNSTLVFEVELIEVQQ